MSNEVTRLREMLIDGKNYQTSEVDPFADTDTALDLLMDAVAALRGTLKALNKLSIPSEFSTTKADARAVLARAEEAGL